MRTGYSTFTLTRAFDGRVRKRQLRDWAKESIGQWGLSIIVSFIICPTNRT